MANRCRRLSNADIRAALADCEGSIPRAARLLGVSRQALHYRVNKTPHLILDAQEFHRLLVDHCKIAISEGLRSGHMPTIRWFMDNFAENRGYGRGEGAAAAYDARVDKLLLALGYTPKQIQTNWELHRLHYAARFGEL